MNRLALLLLLGLPVASAPNALRRVRRRRRLSVGAECVENGPLCANSLECACTREPGRRLFGAPGEAPPSQIDNPACTCQYAPPEPPPPPSPPSAPPPDSPPPVAPPPAPPRICPDFAFDGTHLTADKCPYGWTCSAPYASSGGGCGSYNGVFVGSQSITTASCNDCMTPPSHDGYFFKIAWDNQCGFATSSAFVLPAGTRQVRFMVGGGADAGGMWVKRASDDSQLCSYTGPPQCPMDWRYCDFGADMGGTEVTMLLEKPCSGSGGWENLVFDAITFVDSGNNNLQMPCMWPPP